MRGFRWSVLCCVGAIGLLAAACSPPTTPTNVAPIAVVSADPSSGVVPLPVTFSSVGSTDPDGSIVSYSWDFGDGSPLSTTAETSHTYVAQGTYAVVLTVTDDEGRSSTATTSVSAAPAANVAPVAAAAATPDAGPAPLEVQFSSAGSSDPDGSIVSYSWDFGDGSPLSTEADPGHTYTAAGPIAATLTVTDDGGAVDTASVVVTVVPNQAPVAAASGTPTLGRAPLPVTFSAAGSTDPDGSIVSYSWDFGDGSPLSSDADTSHTYTAVGSFTAVLTVVDDEGLTDTAQVAVVTTVNQPPTAVVQATPAAGLYPLEVTFDPTGSTDPDGTIASYSWDFGDGSPLSSEVAPVHTYTDPGTYTPTLTVTDDEGATDVASTSILVDAVPNQPPTAQALADVTSGKEPLTVSFGGAGSTDPDGTIVSYSWDFGDGSPLSSDADTSHTYVTAGVRTATLTVTDDDGATAAATVVIETVPNQGPTAAAASTPTTGKAPLPVLLSSAGSTDPDGTIVSYSWNFGDGSPLSTDPEPSHVFGSAGTYEATLTVTDDNGATDSAVVVVIAVANVAPTAVATADHQSGARPLTVEFSSAASVDPDGTIVSYDWAFGDGDTSTDASPTHVYGAGTWTATVTVTDDSGASSTSTAVTITAVIDDDADGVSPPADCDDADPTIHPGAPDVLDVLGTDSNCDGYDGVVTAQTFVSAGGGSDTGSCGTPSVPCASIGHAQTRATAAGHSIVAVAGGSYGAFTVANGLTVRGGYGQNFLRGGSATGTAVTTVTAAANATVGGPTAVLVDGLTTATRVMDLTAQGIAAPAGQASYGVVVRNSSNLFTLERVTVNGGTGGAGTAGAPGSSASQTAAAGGGNGENAERASAACSTSRKSGGGGATTSVAGANGGGGGQGGARDSSCPFSLSATNGNGGGNAATTVGSLGTAGGGGNACDCGEAGTGGSGQPGRTQHGTGGTAGALSPVNGGVSGSGFWAVSGGTGGTGALGLDGTGGGGGGGGGGNDSGTDAMGAGGGGGGAGGARAVSPGAGGSAGAASIAIYVNNSTPTLLNVVVNLGNGGQGGTGGSGALGQPGGSGGAGGSPDWGGRGGNGGSGGSGGNSGAGGGGAGGPAFGLLTRSASVSASGVTYAGGAGGTGGAAGTGGVTGTVGVAGVRSTIAAL